jgi:hypothetical protein
MLNLVHRVANHLTQPGRFTVRARFWHYEPYAVDIVNISLCSR